MQTRKKGRGGGMFNRIKAAFTRKKVAPVQATAAPVQATAAPQAPLRQPLSWTEERRLKELQAQRSKSKEQQENQARLEQRAREDRVVREEPPPRQRGWLNRLTRKAQAPLPESKPLFVTPVEGISDVYANSRSPLRKANLRIPNSQIPPPPYLLPDEVRQVNGEPVQLASQVAVEAFNIPLLVAMATGTEPKASVEEIPDEEFQSLAKRIRDLRASDKELEEIIPELFGKSLEEMNQWVFENEEGEGYQRGEYKLMPYDVTLPDGTKKRVQLIKVRGAGDINRYLARIASGKRSVLLAKENNDHLCIRDAANNTQDSYSPLTTLKSNGCFTLINSERFSDIGQSETLQGERVPEGAPKSYIPSLLRKNWILVPPKYMPIETAPFLPIQAKYFGSASYIQDALTDWAVEGIDPLFLQLLQAKYPQYAIKFTTYVLNTKDYSYQEQKLKTSLGFAHNYAVIDKEIFPQEVGFTARNPFRPPSAYAAVFDAAARQKKLYGVTPYLAYAMKSQVSTLWQIAFDSPTQAAYLEVYSTLRPQEKITIDFLQSLLWKDRLLGTNLSFSDARLIYTLSLQDAALRKKMIELYLLNPMESRRELVFYQKIVTKEYKGEPFVEQVRKAEIETLLARIARQIQEIVSPQPLAVSALFANLDVEPEAPPPSPPPRSPRVSRPLPRFLPEGPAEQPRRISWSSNLVPPQRAPKPSVAGPPPQPKGAFVLAAESSKEAERAKLRFRKSELLSYLGSLQSDFDRLTPRISNLEARSRFLQTKKRYGKLSNVELRNLRNAAVLKEFPSLKQRAEQELQRIQGLLDRLGT